MGPAIADCSKECELYRVLNRDGRPTGWIGLVVGEGFWVYYAGNRAFQRVASVEADYLFSREFTYQPVTTEEASAAIRAGAGRIDPNTRPELVERLDAERELLPADVVLGAAD